MKSHLTYFLTIYLAMTAGYANITTPPSSPMPRVIQDPDTKIIIYLETDQCHLSAVSPKGKLLWSVDIFPHANGNAPKISEFSVAHGYVQISGSGGGYGSIVISVDVKTGEQGMVDSI